MQITECQVQNAEWRIQNFEVRKEARVSVCFAAGYGHVDWVIVHFL